MRRFDVHDATLAIELEAKVFHVVELIGSHRCLAALSRAFKENQCRGRLASETRATFQLSHGLRVKSSEPKDSESAGLGPIFPQPPLRHPVRHPGSGAIGKNPKKSERAVFAVNS
jgi:hypothetical protein